MTTLRSFLFLAGSVPITAVYGILVPIGGLFGWRAGSWFAQSYTRVMMRWVELSLGITCEIEGWEHVPAIRCADAKHQCVGKAFHGKPLPAAMRSIKKEAAGALRRLESVWIRCSASDRSSGTERGDQWRKAAAAGTGHWVRLSGGHAVAPAK